MRTTPRLMSGMATMVLLAGCATAARSPELPLYAGQPLPTYHVTVADADGTAVLAGTSAVVTKPADASKPRAPTTVLKHVDEGRDALTLRWQDIWYAGLKIEGGTPLDLSPYVDSGTMEFDLKVNELAKGGLSFKLACGKDCERKVPYVVPGRAAAGQGWRHIALAMRCFVRTSGNTVDQVGAIDQPFALDGTGTGEVSIANIVVKQRGTANTDCPDYRTVSVTPATLDESWSLDWWLPRHQAKLEEVRALKAKGLPPQLVFIGDSITHGWEKEGAKVWERRYAQYHALDLGFSGDRTENVLWRLQHGEVDGIDPKVAVLMFGTNNTGHRQEDPATTAAGIARNVEELKRRLPNTKILLLAIFPREESPAGPLRRLNQQVNEKIARLADNRRVYFADINQAFLRPDGTLSRDIMPDLLHPNEKGYTIWADAMDPVLKPLLAQ